MDIKKKIYMLVNVAFILYVIWLLMIVGSFGIVDDIDKAWDTYMITDDYIEESLAYQTYENKLDFYKQYDRIGTVIIWTIGLILLFILVLVVNYWRNKRWDLD